MSNYNELLNLIKKASTEAVEAEKPVNVCFGKVTSSSPLKILVDQKITLGKAQLVLTRNVTDFKIDVTLHDWKTEDKGGGSGDPAFETHKHDIVGKKQMTLHHALKNGEEVVLLRMQGGQKYLVLDRVVKI